MKSLLFHTLAATAILALAGGAQAATMTAPVSASGEFTVTDTTGPRTPKSYSFQVTPTTAPNPVVFFDTSISGGQDPASIASLIVASYGLTSQLATQSTCDDVAGGCAGTTSTSSLFSLTNVAPFEYLAVHLGGGELFFHFAQPITSVALAALDGFPGGVSNYRSYLATPIPGALALFLGAMGIMGARRKLAPKAQTPQFATA